MSERVKIHVDLFKPVTPTVPCIHVCRMDGTILATGRRVRLKGEWVVRQYRNLVPCGATVVLYPDDPGAQWTMEVTE